MKAYRFVHLNVHSHYSINDGCASIRELVDAAIKDRMPGIAITDNGNMFGIMEFFGYVSRINIERPKKGMNPFKPIIGCELYVARRGSKEQKENIIDINGYHLTVLAKNQTGYKNLIKIVSNAWTENTADPNVHFFSRHLCCIKPLAILQAASRHTLGILKQYGKSMATLWVERR